MELSAERIAFFHCPRWEELPAIPLYMDQVILVLEEALGLLAGSEAVLTPTMINNYVKLQLVAPPIKKKYGRPHLAPLAMVSVLKKVLSMNEIGALAAMMTEQYGIERAYDLFCERLEFFLRLFFVEKQQPIAIDLAGGDTQTALDLALTALMGRLALQNWLGVRLLPAPAAEKKASAKSKKGERAVQVN